MMLEIFFLGWLWSEFTLSNVFCVDRRFVIARSNLIAVSLITAAAIWVSDMATSGGYLNMTPGQREKYEEIRHTPESLERKKLLSPESTSDLSVDDLLQPQSDISIRNRYLSRVGAMVTKLFFFSLTTYFSASTFRRIKDRFSLQVPPHAKAPIHRPLR